MEKFKLEIDRRKIIDIVSEGIHDEIKSVMKNSQKDIRLTIEEYFNRDFFNRKTSQFEMSLDYTIENAFKEGLGKAMKEMDFTEIIATKAKELLSKDSFITDLAEAKVRSSLGLPAKE